MEKIECQSLSSLKSEIEQARNSFNMGKGDIIVYRGQADEDYKFEPSLFRKKNKNVYKNEAKLLEKIEIERPKDFSNMTTLERLVKMQSYGFATRILDVTSDEHVALYFAAQASKKDKNNEQHNGKLFICSIPEKNVKSFDDETVICLVNLAKLSEDEKKKLAKALQTKRNNEDIVKKFTKIIRAEYPNFELPKDLDLYTPVFVHVKKDNPRISAQSGAFIVFGLKDKKFEHIKRKIFISTQTIEAKSKKNIREQLDEININRRTLFPELNAFLVDALKQARAGNIDF